MYGLPHNFGLKDSFSGDFMIWSDTDLPEALRNIYGPYPNPFEGPMLNNCNYTCHNLFTNYVDRNGEIPEDQIKFPEQTPYYEWKNSDYSNSNVPSEFKTCQGCHMPQSTSAIKISTVAPAMTSEREPFWYHHFVGGNYFMPPLLRDNIDLIGVTATVAHFDTGHDDYKYMMIKGDAANDPDFNLNNNGADTVHYEIPIGASSGPFTVDIEVSYQTVTPDEVFHLTNSASNINIPEIKLFHDLYKSADKAPVILEFWC